MNTAQSFILIAQFHNGGLGVFLNPRRYYQLKALICEADLHVTVAIFFMIDLLNNFVPGRGICLSKREQDQMKDGPIPCVATSVLEVRHATSLRSVNLYKCIRSIYYVGVTAAFSPCGFQIPL